MLIDWFTVIAQILNFLILVGLLKHFLYKPILNAIDERERRIRAQIAEAAERNVEAEKQKSILMMKNEVFDKERDNLMQGALDEINAEKQMLLKSVHREYDSLRAKRMESLLEEEHAIYREVIQRTQEEIFAITRKVLQDLASSSLEERMAEVFIRQIRSLHPAETEKLIRSFRSSSMPVILRSAFELSETQRNEIQAAVAEIVGMDTPVQFEISKELIGGIELVTNGYKVAWNIADTLAAAGKHAGKVLREKQRQVSQEGGAGNGSS